MEKTNVMTSLVMARVLAFTPLIMRQYVSVRTPRTDRTVKIKTHAPTREFQLTQLR